MRKSIKNGEPAMITAKTTKKERTYGEEAEFLFVDLMYTFKEIAAKIPVAESTIRDWCDKYNWIEQKKERLRNRISIRTELESFCIDELKALRTERAEGKDIAQSRFYTVMRLTELTFRAKEYDDKIRGEAKVAEPKPAGLDEEKRKEIEKEFGLV